MNEVSLAVTALNIELHAFRQEALIVEEGHQLLKDQNFEMVSKLFLMENEMKKMKDESLICDDKLAATTRRNEELLRLLEAEKVVNAIFLADVAVLKDKEESLMLKYGDLLKTGKSYEELANEALKEGEHRAAELQKLRKDTELSKKEHLALKVKTDAELESLEEQLRLRKEKQYQLMEKLQLQEEARREAEDRVAALKEVMQNIKTKNSELETQTQLEISSKFSAEETNRTLRKELKTASDENRALINKLNESNQERLRIEAETRGSGEKLREMAEKVFQLLEKLKLSDFAKNRALEALRTKEQEMLLIQKKISCLEKKFTEQETKLVQIEQENAVLVDQIRSIKKHNNQLGQKCKEEAKQKVQEEEQRKLFEERNQILESRLSFLLNKLQSDEESKTTQRGEAKKLEGQLIDFAKKNETLERNANEAREESRTLSNHLREKAEELQSLQVKVDLLSDIMDQRDKELAEKQALKGKTQDDPTRHFAGGRLRFFPHTDASSGIITLKGKCQKDRDWIEQHGCNQMLRKSLKNPNIQEAVTKNFAEICGVWMATEESCLNLMCEVQEQRLKIDKVVGENDLLQAKLCSEEETKRRILLLYIAAVKASVSIGEPGSEKERNEVGRVGAGRIHLPEINLTDEEVHAVVATIRDNVNIAELNLRGNGITDEGARVIASLLTGKNGLHILDLRGNHISQYGIRMIASALESSQRVTQICVHAGGRIEAFGLDDESKTSVTNHTTSEGDKQVDISNNQIASRRALCVVDIRENYPQTLTC